VAALLSSQTLNARAATWHAGHAWFAPIIGAATLAVRIILAAWLIAIVATGPAVLAPARRTPTIIVSPVIISSIVAALVIIAPVITARRTLTTIPLLTVTLFPTAIIRTTWRRRAVPVAITGTWRWAIPVTVTRTWQWAVPIARAWWRRSVPAGRWSTPIITRWARTAPTIAITIKITVAIIAIPVGTDIEGDDRNAQIAVITWFHINAVLAIFGLNITARYPATSTTE
jgi:hypothetical protein